MRILLEFLYSGMAQMLGESGRVIGRLTRLFSTKTGILSKNTDKKMDKNWTLIFFQLFYLE